MLSTGGGQDSWERCVCICSCIWRAEWCTKGKLWKWKCVWARAHLCTYLCWVAKQRLPTTSVVVLPQDLSLLFLTVEPVTYTRGWAVIESWAFSHPEEEEYSLLSGEAVGVCPKPMAVRRSSSSAMGGKEDGTLREAKRWSASWRHFRCFCDPRTLSALPFLLWPLRIYATFFFY